MQLTAVRDLVDRPAPFVTVHAEVGRPAEDAVQQLETRWNTIRRTLEGEGVDPGLVEEIGRRLHEMPPAPGEARRTIVAAEGDIVFDEVLPGSVRIEETAEVALLPDLAGWVATAARQLPFCLVVADREGADVSFHSGLADTDPESDAVDGEEHQLHKVPGGGWAHRRMQQSVENTWKENAQEVAKAVTSGVRRLPLRLVIVAGDQNARQKLQESLDGLTVPVVHVEAGGRAAGASEEALWSEVEVVLARFEAEADLEVAERLAAVEGQQGRAVRGLGEVLDALTRGQVETVVLDLQRARDLTVDPSAHPGLPLPEGAAGELPADRVLLAAAAATSAGVTVLPAEQSGPEGVAALLRWDDATSGPGQETV